MRLMGCTMGLSSSIAPDDLFCGGNLELRQPRAEDGNLVHHSSTIRKIGCIRRRQAGQGDD